jgi:hypothetical protein
MKKNFAFLISVVAALTLVPVLANASNAGDFSGGVAIGTAYAGVDAAPTDGLIVSGAVGIGTTAPSVPLVVIGTAEAGSFMPTGSTKPAYGIYAPSSTLIGFSTNSTNALTIDNSQDVLINSTTAYSAPGPFTPIFQINGATTAAATEMIERWGAGDIAGPSFYFAKSRGASIGSHGAVLSGDFLGTFRALGDDGANPQVGGQFSFSADGNFSSTSAPTRFSIFVSKVNDVSLSNEALRIDNAGHWMNKNTSKPTLSTCGTSPSAGTSNDVSGTITEGTTATGCTVTFGTTWSTAPNCVVTSQSGLTFSYTVSTTALVVTNIGALSSKNLTYFCMSN